MSVAEVSLYTQIIGNCLQDACCNTLCNRVISRHKHRNYPVQHSSEALLCALIGQQIPWTKGDMGGSKDWWAWKAHFRLMWNFYWRKHCPTGKLFLISLLQVMNLQQKLWKYFKYQLCCWYLPSYILSWIISPPQCQYQNYEQTSCTQSISHVKPQPQKTETFWGRLTTKLCIYTVQNLPYSFPIES